MHAISSYRGIRPTTTQTDNYITIHGAAAAPACSVRNWIVNTVTPHLSNDHYPPRYGFSSVTKGMKLWSWKYPQECVGTGTGWGLGRFIFGVTPYTGQTWSMSRYTAYDRQTNECSIHHTCGVFRSSIMHILCFLLVRLHVAVYSVWCNCRWNTNRNNLATTNRFLICHIHQRHERPTVFFQHSHVW